MTKSKFTDDELQFTDQWLTTATRFVALNHGHAENCKRRDCKDGGVCMAESMNPNPDKNACGIPLKPGDVALTVQLALFGMMLEEGLLKSPDDPNH